MNINLIKQIQKQATRQSIMSIKEKSYIRSGKMFYEKVLCIFGLEVIKCGM